MFSASPTLVEAFRSHVESLARGGDRADDLLDDRGALSRRKSNRQRHAGDANGIDIAIGGPFNNLSGREQVGKVLPVIGGQDLRA